MVIYIRMYIYIYIYIYLWWYIYLYMQYICFSFSSSNYLLYCTLQESLASQRISPYRKNWNYRRNCDIELLEKHWKVWCINFLYTKPLLQNLFIKFAMKTTRHITRNTLKYSPQKKNWKRFQKKNEKKCQLLNCKRIDVSGHWKCSVKKGVLRNFAKFTGKHLCQRLLFNKVAGLRHT